MIYPKSRDITLPTKVCIVKAMVFPVVMYGCENWVIKKAECQRTDAFELWCWRRLSRVPWTARRSNQLNPKGDLSWIFIGRTAAEAELQSFGHLMGRANSLEKTLLLWKTEGRRRRGDGGWDGWWHHWLSGCEFEQALGDAERQRSRCAAVCGTLLSSWPTTTLCEHYGNEH